MSRFIKNFYTIIMLFTVLTACARPENVSVPDVIQSAVQSALPEKEQTVVSEKEQTMVVQPPSFADYDGYINYIASRPEFEPYYKTVFAFEGLPNGVSSVPLEKVKAMYNELKTTFNYVVVSEYPLEYLGYYDSDTNFVDGYKKYVDTGGTNPVNVAWNDWDGNQTTVTPLKTVLLDESTFGKFDSKIEKGRNLQISDFTLAAPKEPISIVLGNSYNGMYKIGDILSLQLISKVMNFKVVGFYKTGTGFSMDVGAQHNVNFDDTIVMPHFIPNYEPVGEAEIYQHAFHLAELTSGCIAITEPVKEISEDTHNSYKNLVEEMAARNGLSGLYKFPYWPVGFVW